MARHKRGESWFGSLFVRAACLNCMCMRRGKIILFLASLVLAGCGYRETPQQRRDDANTPAGKVGQAAHKVAVEAGKASRAVGRQLDQAAHDAREGWKEAGRKDQKQR